MVLICVTIVMIPIFMDTIRLQQSRLFSILYEKVSFVQEILAGPFFLIILQAFLAAVDCTGGAVATEAGNPNRIVVELKPAQVCWESDHLIYATIGLTGLMAYVPLAVRFPPLFLRIPRGKCRKCPFFRAF